MAEKLDGGAQFPAMTLQFVGGDSLVLPDQLDAAYTVLLFYRGHW